MYCPTCFNILEPFYDTHTDIQWTACLQSGCHYARVTDNIAVDSPSAIPSPPVPIPVPV